MRHLFPLIVALFCLSACGSDPVSHDGDPVDGPYTARLSGLHETCYDLAKPEGSAPFVDEKYPDVTVEIDAFLRADGLVDLKHSSNRLPGSLDGVIPGLDRAGGEVNQFHHVASPNSETSISSKGRFTPEMLSLDFVETYNDGKTYCEFTTHAEGTRRPLTDMTDPDGIYVTQIAIWDGCPAAIDGKPSYEGAMRISATKTAKDSLEVTLDDGLLRFVVPMPGTDDTIDYEGPLQRSVFTPTTPEEGPRPDAQGTMKGTFSPERTYLVLDYADPANAAAGCGSIMVIDGRKMQPRRDAIVDDYRMTFDLSGDCLAGPRTQTGTATVLKNADGTFTVKDFGGPFAIALDHGRFDGTQGDLTTDGFEARFTGTLTPPFLDYRIEQQESTYHGLTCNVVIEAHGETRYVF